MNVYKDISHSGEIQVLTILTRLRSAVNHKTTILIRYNAVYYFGSDLIYCAFLHT